MGIFRRLRIFFRHMKPSVFTGLCLTLCIAILTVGTKLHGEFRKHDRGLVGVKARRVLESDEVKPRLSITNSQLQTLNVDNSFVNTMNNPKDDSVLRNPRYKDDGYKVRFSEKQVQYDKGEKNYRQENDSINKEEDINDTDEGLLDNIGQRKSSVFVSFLKAVLTGWNVRSEKRKRMVEKAFNSAYRSPLFQKLFTNSNSPASREVLLSVISDSRLQKLVASDNITVSDIIQACRDIVSLSKVPKNSISQVSQQDKTFMGSQAKTVKQKNNLQISEINSALRDSHKTVNSQGKRTVQIFKQGSSAGRVSKISQVNRRQYSDKQGIENSIPVVSVPASRSRDETSLTKNKIVDGIFWSDTVERSIPKGISNSEADSWIAKSRTFGFKSLQPPDWNRCGRPHNAFVVLNDDTEMCARYRAPLNRMIQGETLSYWLARLMALDNVPPVSLSALNSSQWDSQRPSFTEVQWSSRNYVALIMWIHEMDSRAGNPKVLMPLPILKSYKSGKPLDGATLISYFNMTRGHNNDKNLNGNGDPLTSLSTIAQWGSMILFDYLTGNYDRVASMQDGADREKNPNIIEESIRNLKKSKTAEKLWLIDNESGLLDAYSLLYGPDNGHRFIAFHDQMLHTMCIFQRRVARRLQALHRQEQAYRTLERYTRRKEPLFDKGDKDNTYELFILRFPERLDTVVKWIRKCEQNERLKAV